MAIISCSECSNSVSDKARVCPHCGIDLKPVVAAPISSNSSNIQQKSILPKLPPIEKQSDSSKAVRIIVIFFIIGGVLQTCTSLYESYSEKNITTPETVIAETATPKPLPAPTPAELKKEALELTKLNYNWHKGGFDNVMLVDFTIKNNSKVDIKDMTIKCSHYSNSETKIDSNERQVFELVKAGKTKKVKDFSMGLIHSQTQSTSCSIINLVVVSN